MVAGSPASQATAPTSRPARNERSKRSFPVRASSRSSSAVRRSMRSVARPARWRAPATARLRGLWRLLPLPWANTTIPAAAGGIVRSPDRPGSRCTSTPSPLPTGPRSPTVVDGLLDHGGVDGVGRGVAAGDRLDEPVGLRSRHAGADGGLAEFSDGRGTPAIGLVALVREEGHGRTDQAEDEDGDDGQPHTRPPQRRTAGRGLVVGLRLGPELFRVGLDEAEFDVVPAASLRAL